MFCLTLANCSKTEFSVQQVKEEEFTNNFQNILMEGKTIDPQQTWSTAKTVQLDVFSEIAEGVLKVYAASPVGQNVPALYVSSIEKGEQKTISVTCPADATQLYVAVYDSENYMRYEVASINGNKLSVTFASSNADTANSRRAPGTSFPNTHTFLSKPDPSIYAQSVPAGVAYLGDLRDPWGGRQIYHFTVYQFWIDAEAVAATKSMNLQPGYGNQPTTTYIVGTVNAPNDLYLTAGSKLYLTKGSKFVLPNGDYSFGQSNVQIIIAEGAELVCKGKLQFSNTTLYNNGTVTVKNLECAGSGKVYNDAKGTLDIEKKLTIANNNSEVVNDGELNAEELQVNGSGHFMNNNKANIGGNTVVNSNNNSWVNNGTFHCNDFLYNGGGSYNVINNCKLICDDQFYIGLGQNQGEFKLDGSIECKNFIHGIGNTRMAGKSIIKVAETLTCQAMADGCYFGFYGPDSDANGYAVVQAKKITAKKLTQRRSISYRGYLIVATDDHWEQCDANDSKVNGNYPYWDQGDHVKMSLKNKNDITQTITPTDCNVGISGQTIVINEPKQYFYYAFEDLGTTDDFDFNDVVVRVSAPENGESEVELIAAGGTLVTYVTYGLLDNKKTLGGEVHAVFGETTKTMVNTGYGSHHEARSLGKIKVDSNAELDNLPIGIDVKGNGCQVVRVSQSVENIGRPPLVIVTCGYPSGTNAGKWFWPSERTKISAAYTNFGNWGANASSYKNWYQQYTEDKVYKW